MTTWLTLVTVTVRGLLGRRRLILMLLLAGVPVLLGVLVQIRGGRQDVDRVLSILVVQTVMPLVALILGTASLGSEIEDGTIVFLLTKPIPRWVIASAKVAVAVAATGLVVVPVTVLTGLLVGGAGAGAVAVVMAFAVAVVFGGAAYAALFVALSSLTSRALIIGLVYVLIWEGALGGLLEGTKFLSIRQATLGLAQALGADLTGHPLDGGVGLVVLVVAIAAAFGLTAWRLARFEVRGGD